MQGRRRAVSEGEGRNIRQQDASSDVREDEEEMQGVREAVAEAIQEAEMSHQAAEGAEIQETSAAVT